MSTAIFFSSRSRIATKVGVGFLLQTLSPVHRHSSSPSSSPCSRRMTSGESSDEGSENDPGVSMVDRDRDGPPKLFVVQPRLRPEPLLQTKLSEALNLAESVEDRRDGDGVDGKRRRPPYILVQNPMVRSRGNADKFFGPGTVENVKCQLQAIDAEDGPYGVFVNAILSGVQQRNLENAWGKPVLDRIGLIIEIFYAHAQTKEAKLQSELAALMYKSTRLVRVRGPSGRLTFGVSGEAEVVSAKGKGSGGRGFLSGAGESELHLQRRRIHERREQLLSEIEEVRRTRALHRYARKRHGGTLGRGLATVAVVGYTNAGKSTLVSALSRSDLYRDDRLFATVDPCLRSVVLPSGRKALLSDTVGFISDLPVQLVEAFHATLEEVVDADLLVHVLDSSAKDFDDQRSTVLEVLKKIGVSDEKIENMIEVWNKIDLQDGEYGETETQEHVEGSNDGLNESVYTCKDDSLLQQLPRSHVEIASVEDLSEIKFPGEDKKDANIDLKPLDDVGSQSSSGAPSQDQEIVNYKGERDNMEPHRIENIANGKSLTSALKSNEPPANPSLISQSEGGRCVKTSAIKGVGLQELLHLIDIQLGSKKSSSKENTPEIFHRKLRPTSHHGKDEAKLAIAHTV